MDVEERLWDMVSAVPESDEAASAETPAMTSEEKQRIYQEARRPVLQLERSLRVARREGYSAEQIADLEQRLSAAKGDAAADIFAQLNAQGLGMGDGGFGEFRQDYHGLHIPEAEARLSQLIEHILPVVGSVVIITGRGAHSHKGNAKLLAFAKKLVMRPCYCDTVDLAPVEGNPGAVRLRTR